MAQAYVMFVDNDMLVEVDGLQDSSDDSYLNAATVTANLFDENGTLVTGQTTIRCSTSSKATAAPSRSQRSRAHWMLFGR
jgi:hypothetical protein